MTLSTAIFIVAMLPPLPLVVRHHKAVTISQGSAAEKMMAKSIVRPPPTNSYMHPPPWRFPAWAATNRDWWFTQTSTDLVHWQDTPTVVTSIVPAKAGCMFYRVRLKQY